jgi:soluble lytic murein transglycosylase
MEISKLMIASTLAVSLAILTSPVQDGMATSPAPYSAATSSVLSAQDRALVQQGLTAARARDVVGTQSIASRISDPTARKLVKWALVDTSDRQLPYYDLMRANNELAQWPRSDSRRAAGERALYAANPSPDQVLAFFNGQQPTTAEGAIALAGALEQSGQVQAAQDLIRNWWRGESFEEAHQSRVYARWGGWLTTDDHVTRLNMLLLGPHGPATRAMVAMVPADRQQVANVVMNLRAAYAPDAVVGSLSQAQANDPAVVLERVRLLRSSSRQAEAFPLLRALPAAPSHREGQNTLWSERRNYFLDALQQRNHPAAYDAMAGHGFPSGERKVDAEFFAGWVALTKLNDPARAAQHFETLRQASSTPITQGRALYWLGRAAEASGDQAGAQAWYQAGAAHWQTFYGQLAMEKAGLTTLTLPSDPAPSPEEVRAFEANEVVRATRILADLGETNLTRVFAYHLDDSLPSISDMAQLFDLLQNSGDQFGAMMVGRASSQRGMVMPERMYPIRVPTAVPGAARVHACYHAPGIQL